MNAIRRTLSVATAVAFAFTLGACDGKKDNCSTNPSGPTCTTLPPPPVACTQSGHPGGRHPSLRSVLRAGHWAARHHRGLDERVK
jgi:hypothetical protein